jgi:simple sugar transport system permease protein
MRLEPIPNPTLARQLGLPAAALGATVLIASLLALLAGANPFAVLGQIVTGAVGSKFALLETLNRATPLIFTGLAVAVAFKAKLWNIGVEAQLYAGAIVAVLLGTGAVPAPFVLPATAALLAKTKVIRDKTGFFMGFSKVRCNPYKQTLCHPPFSPTWCGFALI